VAVQSLLATLYQYCIDLVHESLKMTQ